MKSITNHATASNRAGTTVADLLRDIGEASASTNPVELFRLCLDAQRLLSATPASATTKDEAELLASYRAMADDARIDMLCVADSFAKTSSRQRPALTLVRSSHAYRGEAV